MSYEIDNRIVEMQFRNKEFEKNIKKSTESLEKLKSGLDLKGAEKSLTSLYYAGKAFNLSAIANSVDHIAGKFSALGIIGMRTLQNIADKAYYTGKNIAKAFTVDPIKTGFSEYETQINATQTILANVQREGKNIDDVTRALDELNEYADRTIYNFTQMTENIGRFTAAGVDLDTSVGAIKGIANLAAISGSTPQQASNAMYQLSQALASGTVRLQDWISVQNASMGGKLFQESLIETARVAGVSGEEAKKGFDLLESGAISFRDSLQYGWLSSEVLTDTLAKFTGDLSEAELIAKGYTTEQVKEILEIGKTANDAATKVKTFTQLFDTLKEAAQSGWSQSWRTIIGDFEEAKGLLTSISDRFGAVIQRSADARNKILDVWKMVGGRDLLIEGVQNLFDAIGNVSTLLKSTVSEFFPPATAEGLFNITKSFRDFTLNLKSITSLTSGGDGSVLNGLLVDGKNLSPEMSNLQRIIRGIASGLKLVKTIGLGAFGLITKAITFIGPKVFDIAADIGDFVYRLNDSFTSFFSDFDSSGLLSSITNFFKVIWGYVGSGGERVLSFFGKIFEYLKSSRFVQKAADTIANALNIISGAIPKGISAIKTFAKNVLSYIKSLGIFSGFGSKIKNSFETVKTFILSTIQSIRSLFSGVGEIGGVKDDPKQYFENLWASIQEWAKTFSDNISNFVGYFYQRIKEALTPLKDWVSNAFSRISEVFGNLLSKAPNINIVQTLSNVLGVAALYQFVKALSSFSSIGKSLSGLGESLKGFLKDGLKITKKEKKIDSIGTTALKIAASFAVLVGAIYVLTKMDPAKVEEALAVLGKLALGLAGMAILFKMTSGADGVGKNFLELAGALTLLLVPIYILGTMDNGIIVKGAAIIGGLLFMISTFMRASKALGKSTGLIAIAASLTLLLIPLNIIGNMDWGKLGKGLLGISVLLLALGAFNKYSKGLGKSTGLVATAVALNLLLIPIKILGGMKFADLSKGVGSIAVLLLSFGGMLAAINKTGGATQGTIGMISVMAAAAGLIYVFGMTLKEVSDVPWERMVGFAGGIALVLTGIAAAISVIGKIPTGTLLKGTVGLSAVLLALGGVFALLAEIAAGVVSNIGVEVQKGTNSLKHISDSAKSIDPAAIDTAVESFKKIKDIVVEFVGIDTSGYNKVGPEITLMGTRLKLFSANVSGIKMEDVNNAEKTAESIRIVYDKLGGISGVENAESISVSIAKIGAAMKLYSDSVSGVDIDGIGVKGASGKAEVIATLVSEIAEAMIATDIIGKVSKLSVGGGDELTSFSLGLTNLTTAISSYSNSTVGIDTTKMNNVTDALENLVDVKGKLGTEGGLIEFFTGNGINFIKFGEETSALGTALSDYYTSISGIDANKFGAVTSLIDELGEIQSKLPAEGGLWQWLTGTSGFDTFGQNLDVLGQNLGSFYENTKSINTEDGQFSGVLSILQKLADIAVSLEQADTYGLQVDALATQLSNSISAFNEAQTEIEGLDTDKWTAVSNVLYSLGVMIGSMRGYGNNTPDLSGITSVVEALGSMSLPEFNTSGADAAVAFFTGLSNGLQNGELLLGIGEKAKNISIFGAISINGTQDSWYESGRFVGQGFANGILSKAETVRNAARTVALGALGAAALALFINSPSKKFEELGMYSDLGMARGFESNSYLIYDAASKAVSVAISGARKQIVMMNGIMDDLSIRPVISPVIDLTNVSDGIRNMNGMFDSPVIKPTTIATPSSFYRSAGQLAYSGVTTSGQTSQKELVNAISRMEERIDVLNESILKMKLVLNGDVLVGELKTDIDRNLGILESRRKRGN